MKKTLAGSFFVMILFIISANQSSAQYFSLSGGPTVHFIPNALKEYVPNNTLGFTARAQYHFNQFLSAGLTLSGHTAGAIEDVKSQLALNGQTYYDRTSASFSSFYFAGSFTVSPGLSKIKPSFGLDLGAYIAIPEKEIQDVDITYTTGGPPLNIITTNVTTRKRSITSDDSGFTLSPRFGLNYSLSNKHSFFVETQLLFVIGSRKEKEVISTYQGINSTIVLYRDKNQAFLKHTIPSLSLGYCYSFRR